MGNLGEYLKKERKKAGYSLAEVMKRTSISDSRLCKMERNAISIPAGEMRKLADLYGIPIVKLYIKAEYLTDEDLMDYQMFFHGASALTEEEKKHVQQCIDLLTKGREQK